MERFINGGGLTQSRKSAKRKKEEEGEKKEKKPKTTLFFSASSRLCVSPRSGFPRTNSEIISVFQSGCDIVKERCVADLGPCG